MVPSPKRREPRRVPKTVAATPAERASAGCLGLLVLPWFLTTGVAAFISAGLPLLGLEGVIAGAINLIVALPMAIVLGSMSLSAIARAMGSTEPIGITHRAAAGVGVSAIGLFLLAAGASLLAATGVPLALGIIGLLALFAVLLAAMRRSVKAGMRAQKRRKHSGPPKPPWTHPLARTERVNMYSEALADEVNVIAVLAAAALSLVLQNPMPLLAVGGFELLWLATAPDAKWFRARVERKHLAMANDQALKYRDEQREYLASDQLESHQRMIEQVERAQAAIDAAGFPFDAKRLQRIVDHHLWLMQVENYYSDLDIPTRIREITSRVEAARADVQGMSGRALEVLEQRLDVLERRLAQAHELEARLHEVADKRRNLEQTLLLVTESALAGSRTFDEIDEVLLDIEIAEEVVLDLRDDEEALEAEIEAVYAESQASRGGR